MTDTTFNYPDLNTPAVLVDLDTLEKNIQEMSQLASEAGVKLRPHVKVHENATIAKMQIESGACGVETGAIEQAEALAEQGISDIVIAHPNYYGGPRGEKLKKLLNMSSLKLALVIDMFEQAEIISRLAQSAGKTASILIKIDLGVGSRFGVLPGKPVLDLARKLQQLPNIDLKGIYGHEMGAKPTPEGKYEAALDAATTMTDNARMLREESFTIDSVSIGASPTYRSTCQFLKEGRFRDINEIHPGQCVIGDIMYMMAGGNVEEACAVTVLTTVMSTSHQDWSMIDAGYKTFGSESIIARRDAPGFFWNGMPSFGVVQGRLDLWFGRLSAETGNLYFKDPNKRVKFGERLEIIPNNATLVINIHEQIYGVRNGLVEVVIPVTGRGRGN